MRTLPFESQIIKRYQTKQSSVEEALIEMYLAGVSVRRVENITDALWGTIVSSSAVSELNQQGYEKIESWRMQPIQGDHPYIFVDGIYLKRSWEYTKKELVLAIEIITDRSNNYFRYRPSYPDHANFT